MQEGPLFKTSGVLTETIHWATFHTILACMEGRARNAPNPVVKEREGGLSNRTALHSIVQNVKIEATFISLFHWKRFMSNASLYSKLTAEFIGTFFLALTICTAAVHGSAGDYAPFAIAATLMVMIYAVGHISGAHFNPAVTVAVWIRGACDKMMSLHTLELSYWGGTLRLRVQELLFQRHPSLQFKWIQPMPFQQNSSIPLLLST